MTTTPFYLLDLCTFCGAALIGSEIPEHSCGHCGRRFVTPSVAPAGKPDSGEVAGRRGSRPFRRLRFWTVTR